MKSGPVLKGPGCCYDILMERECIEVQHPEDSDSLCKERRRSLLAASKFLHARLLLAFQMKMLKIVLFLFLNQP